MFSSPSQPAAKMVAAAKAAMPTVGDQAAALQLGNFAKATASALAELKAASTKVSSLSLSLIPTPCMCIWMFRT